MSLTFKLLSLWADQKRLDVDTSRCLLKRNKNVACTKCLDVCPSPSTLQVKNEIHFNAQHCLDCMQCTNACPVQVFQDKQTKELFKTIVNREVTTFSCEKRGNKQNQVVLPCLLQMELTHLLLAGKNAKAINIHLNEDSCKKCSLYKEELVEHVKELMSAAEKIFFMGQKEVQITLLNHWNARKEEQQRISRRDFFGALSRRTVSKTVDPLLPFFSETIKVKEKIPVSGERKLLLSCFSRKHRS